MTGKASTTQSRTTMNNTSVSMLIDFYLADMQRRGCSPDAILSNGVTTGYGCDEAHRLMTITHRAADEILWASYAHGLASSGNHSGIAETVRQSSAPGSRVSVPQ